MPDLGNTAVISPTDASNGSGTQPSWLGSAAPSTLDDAGRALQGAVAREWENRSYPTSTGTAPAFVVAYTVAPAALRSGQTYTFTAHAAAVGTDTLNANALGAKGIKKVVAGVKTATAANDFYTGDKIACVYDGTDMVWTNAASISAATTTEQLTGTSTTKSSTPDSVAALWEAGSNITDGATITIGEGGYFNLITSTTAITAFTVTTDKAGRTFRVRFDTARTLTHNATSLILPGAANITTVAGDIAQIRSLGSGNVVVEWYTRGASAPGSGAPVDTQTFTATGAGTWTKPTGGQTMCLVETWGAGGSGGTGVAGAAQGGGGGGGYVAKTFALSALGATEPISVGTGGAAVAVASTIGNGGGNTTFGAAATLVTAYGGGGGGTLAGGGAAGGGGGGATAAGTNGNGATVGKGGDSVLSTEVNSVGNGGTTSTNGVTGYTPNSGGGGGGASADATAANGNGGRSINGGGGGGAGAEDVGPGPGIGGTSVNGGAGGAGAFDASAATAGSQPGGGGGGSEAGDSGAGGNGKAVVTCW